MSKKQLELAKKQKDDEYYTLYEDIQKELPHYDFYNKIVYCNCDDYRKSNFVKYFKNNFQNLGLRKLISTHYVEHDWFEIDKEQKASMYYEYDGKNETTRELNGNGSYDSIECLRILDEVDIVVTNPPFSKEKLYTKLLVEKNKDFIVLAPITILGRKHISKLLIEKQIYVKAYTSMSFDRPNGEKKALRNVIWLSTIKSDHIQTFIKTGIKYNEQNYKKYDGTNIIDVVPYTNIPDNYNEIMGVPISTIPHIHYNQFDIIDIKNAFGNNELTIDGKQTFIRVFIKRISE